MTPRARRAAAVSGFRPGRLLDWHDSSHWSWTAQPCRYCGTDTNLRDSGRNPAHKTCAEAALAEQATEATAAYQQNGHLA